MSTFCGRSYTTLFLVLLLLASLMIAVLAMHFNQSSEIKKRSTLVSFLSSEPSDQFSDADPQYKMIFPLDHGSHPGFRQEWWYFTGNLTDPDGRSFGYQLTFFRFSGEKVDDLVGHPWNPEQIWLAHFAISDEQNKVFYFTSKMSRQGIGLAGSNGEHRRVWVNDWLMQQQVGSECEECFSLQLKAKSERFEIDLELFSLAEPTLQGNNGFSIKKRDGSIASHYYSFPSLESKGRVTVDQKLFEVQGNSWMDHEWSSAMLAANQLGWDWFGLQLDDGSRLMIFQVREESGDHFRTALWVGSDGLQHSIPEEFISMQPKSWWRSTKSGIEYPIEWDLSLKPPNFEIRLTVKSKIPNQEITEGFIYYEGSVSVEGTRSSKTLSGQGYMELTGYQ